jgi:protein-tyrosine phosphatase
LIDIHTHILSGLDDGADTPQVSLEIAKKSREDGVTTVVATPHVMDEDFVALKQKVEGAVITLMDALRTESVDVEVLPGAEVHISSRLLEDPESLRDLALGFRGKYILLELPLQEMPRFTHELVFRLLVKGLVPVLAHPERNMSIMERPERLLELVERGSLVQVNAGSIMGMYGDTVRNTAELLLRNRIVHFIASDAHSIRRRPPGLSQALARAKDLIGDDAKALVEDNPSALLDGRTFEFIAPKKLVPTRKTFFSWLSGVFSSSLFPSVAVGG